MPEAAVQSSETAARVDSETKRLRQQYVLALSQFMGKLSLTPEALQRVKSRLAKATSSPVQALLDQLAAELAGRDSAAAPASTGASAESTGAVAAASGEVSAIEGDGAIAGALLTLLERVVLTPESELEAKRHRQSLLEGIADDELPQFINDLADVISAGLLKAQQEKKELANFVQFVVARMRSLANHLQSLQQDANESNANSNELCDDWSHQVQTIADSVDAATDLESLKRSVSSELESMRSSMSSYQTKEAERKERARALNAEMQQRMDELSSQTSTLKSQLDESRDRLLRDHTTGVHSRFAYEERIVEEFERWQSSKSPLTLVLWDIDYFKSINDTFGHRAGDRVLRLVAQLIQERVRDTDFFARIGGEEFALLLPDTDTASAKPIAEKIRRFVEESGFNHKGNPVRITVSCGITEFSGEDAPASVFERADEALNNAKLSGRNRCVAA